MNHPTTTAPTPALSLGLAWLLQMRWGMFAVKAITLSIAWYGLHFRFPATFVLFLFGVEVISNVGLRLWSKRTATTPMVVTALVMSLDLLLLTSLLYSTGGPANPFSFLFLVYIALGILVLSARWIWAISLLTLLCYSLLFALPSPHHGHAMHSPMHMRLHLEGMWVAYAITTAFIVYFVTRLKRALNERDLQLARLRDLQLRSDKVAALAALAGGAVHEFSTPLSTIALVSKELQHQLQDHEGLEHAVEDAQLIRTEVNRCHHILKELMNHAGETLGESSSYITIPALFEATLAHFPYSARVTATIDPTLSSQQLDIPPHAFARMLRGLLQNAQEASPAETPLKLRATPHHDAIHIQVEDQGTGMSAAVAERLGEPFFTTKQASNGHGLDLFLAKTLMEHLGGDLQVETAPDLGTTITLVFPLFATKP